MNRLSSLQLANGADARGLSAIFAAMAFSVRAINPEIDRGFSGAGASSEIRRLRGRA